MGKKIDSEIGLSESDVEFCRRHLDTWCNRTSNHAIKDRMWEHFMRRPKFNFENCSWPEIADIVKGKV